MKLLKLRIDGVTLFKDKRLELDFIAADRVLSDEEGNFADVFPLPVGILALFSECHGRCWRKRIR